MALEKTETEYVLLPPRPAQERATINIEIVNGHTYFIPPWEDGFLEALKICGSIRQACHLAGVSRRTVYVHREYSPPFVQRMEDAIADTYDKVYEEAWDRAVNGKDKPVFYMGKQIGTTTERSDYLLGLLVKGTHPEMFATKGKLDITTNGESINEKPQVFLPQIEGDTVDSDTGKIIEDKK